MLAYSSHVLQPLDLGTFAPLKLCYRKEIAKLATLDDTASFKKKWFVQAYDKAWENTFTSCLFRTSWVAAGLFLWNLTKGLNSLQVCTPTTPSRQTSSSLNNISNFLQTPRNRSKFFKSIEQLKLGDLGWKYRTVIQKAGKKIDLLVTDLAALSVAYQHLKQVFHELEEKYKKKKWKVPIDPNILFTNVEDLKWPIEEANIQEEVVEEPYHMKKVQLLF